MEVSIGFNYSADSMPLSDPWSLIKLQAIGTLVILEIKCIYVHVSTLVVFILTLQ